MCKHRPDLNTENMKLLLWSAFTEGRMTGVIRMTEDLIKAQNELSEVGKRDEVRL
jgi:hypothetical protein